MAVRLLVIVACYLASIATAAEVLRGEVVGVTDGDTITILVDREPVKVRLAEIDSPECWRRPKIDQFLRVVPDEN